MGSQHLEAKRQWDELKTALIRHYLKPAVTSDLPGRLRLSFKGYQMLPKEALPYLHYVQDVMTMLPGGGGPGRNPAGGAVVADTGARPTIRKNPVGGRRWFRGAIAGGGLLKKSDVGRKNWRRWHAAASRFAWDR